MHLEILSPQNLFLLVSMLIAGILSGYTAGLFGIGGGIVLVPTFLTIFPHLGTSNTIVMHSAVGTCLALIVPTAITASRKQYQMGKLDLGLFRSWIPPVIVGTIVGVLLLNIVSTKFLEIFFTGFLICVTLYSFFRPHEEAEEERPPQGWVKSIMGFITGSISVLLGIGGGTITVPYCKFSGYPMKKSIALSTATSLFIGLGGAIGAILDGWAAPGRPPYSLGYVSLPALLIVTPSVMIFSPMGSRTANAMTNKTLKWVYACFLAGVTGYMVYKVIL